MLMTRFAFPSTCYLVKSICNSQNPSKIISSKFAPFAKMSTASFQDSISNSKAEYRQLGKSGLRVSLPILGGMSYGDSRWAKWVLDEDKVLRVFRVV